MVIKLINYVHLNIHKRTDVWEMDISQQNSPGVLNFQFRMYEICSKNIQYKLLILGWMERFFFILFL